MVKTIEDELCIKAIPKKGILETIRTLPFGPQYVEMRFVAGAIVPPQWKEEYGRDRHVHQCAKKGIMPFSCVKMEYCDGLFVPAEGRIVRINEEWHKDIRAAASQGIVKGGKIHSLVFEIGQPAKTGMDLFLKDYLDSVLKNDYEFYKLNIALTTYGARSYDDGALPGSTLSMDGRVMKLEFGGRLENEEFDKISKWFQELKKKHGG